MTILFGGGDPIKCEPILGSGSHGWSHEFSEDGNWEPLILRDITTSLQEFGPTWSLSKNDAKNIKKLQIPPIQSWILQKYWAQACDMCPVSIFLFEFCHNPRLPTAGVLSPPQSHLELPREVGSGTCPGVCRVFLGPKDYCLEQVKMRCTTSYITTWYLVIFGLSDYHSGTRPLLHMLRAGAGQQRKHVLTADLAE